MSAKTDLPAKDKEFFLKTSQAVFANPFTDERPDILRQIVPGYAPTTNTKGYDLKALGPILHDRLEKLKGKGLDSLKKFNSEDQIVIKYVYLLLVYLHFMDDFNDLINAQLRSKNSPAKVSFADNAISEIKNSGFSDEESVRYFSLFYQLRRAHYFISQALLGDCESMKGLRRNLWNSVFTHHMSIYDTHLWNRMEDFSTLLLGETGSGKGSAAASIGRSGYIPFDRKKGQFTQSFTKTFISSNLSQFSESLIESELFGHCKGAFTGAVSDYKGLFEQCTQNGALFLDEIGDLSIPVQIKLLRVLQERVFSPVGSQTQKRFSGRVIAATNRSLKDLRVNGHFRDDFFYRLSSDIITVPSLRQRLQESTSEMELLVNLLVSRMTGNESPDLTDMILEALKRDLPKNYPWPGNVRELEQAVRRILLTKKYEGDLIACEKEVEDSFLGGINNGSFNAEELLGEYCRLLYKRFGTYEEVARKTKLDRRTVKKYIQNSIN